MGLNFLKLNEDKNEILLFGSFPSEAPSDLPPGILSPFNKNTANSLVFFLIDGRLKRPQQVSAAVLCGFYHLRV